MADQAEALNQAAKQTEQALAEELAKERAGNYSSSLAGDLAEQLATQRKLAAAQAGQTLAEQARAQGGVASAEQIQRAAAQGVAQERLQQYQQQFAYYLQQGQALSEADQRSAALAHQLQTRALTPEQAEAQYGKDAVDAARVYAAQEAQKGGIDQMRIDAETKLENAGLLTRDANGNVTGVDIVKAVATPGIGGQVLSDYDFTDAAIQEGQRASAAQAQLGRPLYQDTSGQFNPAVAIANGANPLTLIQAGYAPDYVGNLAALHGAGALTPEGQVDLHQANVGGALEAARALGLGLEPYVGPPPEESAGEQQFRRQQTPEYQQAMRLQRISDRAVHAPGNYREIDLLASLDAGVTPQELVLLTGQPLAVDDAARYKRLRDSGRLPIELPNVQGLGPPPEEARGELEYAASQTPQAQALRQLAPYAAPEGGYYLGEAAANLPVDVLIQAGFQPEDINAAQEQYYADRNARIQAEAQAGRQGAGIVAGMGKPPEPYQEVVSRPRPIPLPAALLQYMTPGNAVTGVIDASRAGLNDLLLQSGLLTTDKAQADAGQGVYLPTADELRAEGHIPTEYVNRLIEFQGVPESSLPERARGEFRELNGVVYRTAPNGSVNLDSIQTKSLAREALNQAILALGSAAVVGGPVGIAAGLGATGGQAYTLHQDWAYLSPTQQKVQAGLLGLSVLGDALAVASPFIPRIAQAAQEASDAARLRLRLVTAPELNAAKYIKQSQAITKDFLKGISEARPALRQPANELLAATTDYANALAAQKNAQVNLAAVDEIFGGLGKPPATGEPVSAGAATIIKEREAYESLLAKSLQSADTAATTAETRVQQAARAFLGAAQESPAAYYARLEQPILNQIAKAQAQLDQLNAARAAGTISEGEVGFLGQALEGDLASAKDALRQSRAALAKNPHAVPLEAGNLMSEGGMFRSGEQPPGNITGGVYVREATQRFPRDLLRQVKGAVNAAIGDPIEAVDQEIAAAAADLERVKARYPTDPTKWVDISSNLNNLQGRRRELLGSDLFVTDLRRANATEKYQILEQAYRENRPLTEQELVTVGADLPALLQKQDALISDIARLRQRLEGLDPRSYEALASQSRLTDAQIDLTNIGRKIQQELARASRQTQVANVQERIALLQDELRAQEKAGARTAGTWAALRESRAELGKLRKLIGPTIYNDVGKFEQAAAFKPSLLNVRLARAVSNSLEADTVKRLRQFEDIFGAGGELTARYSPPAPEGPTPSGGGLAVAEAPAETATAPKGFQWVEYRSAKGVPEGAFQLPRALMGEVQPAITLIVGKAIPAGYPGDIRAIETGGEPPGIPFGRIESAVIAPTRRRAPVFPVTRPPNPRRVIPFWTPSRPAPEPGIVSPRVPANPELPERYPVIQPRPGKLPNEIVPFANPPREPLSNPVGPMPEALPAPDFTAPRPVPTQTPETQTGQPGFQPPAAPQRRQPLSPAQEPYVKPFPFTQPRVNPAIITMPNRRQSPAINPALAPFTKPQTREQPMVAPGTRIETKFQPALQPLTAAYPSIKIIPATGFQPDLANVPYLKPEPETRTNPIPQTELGMRRTPPPPPPPSQEKPPEEGPPGYPPPSFGSRKKGLKALTQRILIVGWHQGLWEPVVNLETGRVVWRRNVAQIPDIPDARASFTVLKRGKGNPKARYIPMGAVDAYAQPKEHGLSYQGNRKPRKRGKPRKCAKQATPSIKGMRP